MRSHTTRFWSALLVLLWLCCIRGDNTNEVVGRQAIPLAIVQGDTLASAKHSSKSANSTGDANCTSGNANNTNCVSVTYEGDNGTAQYHLWNSTTFIRHNNHTEGKTRRSQSKLVQMKITRLTFHHGEDESISNDTYKSPEGILVGPLDLLPEHPQGNGPQQKQSKTITLANKSASGTPNARPKRQMPLYDDDDDPPRYSFEPPMFESPLGNPDEDMQGNEDDVARSDMPTYRFIGIEPRTIWQRSFPPLPPVSPNSPAPMDEEGPDLLGPQREFDERRFWQPGRQAPLSLGEQLDYGTPDRDYQRSIEDEANRVEERFAGTLLQNRMGSMNRDPITGTRRSFPGDLPERAKSRSDLLPSPFAMMGGSNQPQGIPQYSSPIGLPPGPSRFTQMLQTPLMAPDEDEYPTKGVAQDRDGQLDGRQLRPAASLNLLLTGTMPTPGMPGMQYSAGLSPSGQDPGQSYPAFVNPLLAAAISRSQRGSTNLLQVPWPVRLLDRRSPFPLSPAALYAQQFMGAARRQGIASDPVRSMLDAYYRRGASRTDTATMPTARSSLAAVPVYSIRSAAPGGVDPHNAVQYAFVAHPITSRAPALTYHPLGQSHSRPKGNIQKQMKLAAEQDEATERSLESKHENTRSGMGMFRFAAESDEEKDGMDKDIDVLQHKDILHMTKTGNAAEGDEGLKGVSMEGNALASGLTEKKMARSLRTAVKFVLGESVKRGNMTEEQSNRVQEKINTILNSRANATKNNTKSSKNAMVNSGKPRALDCKDMFKECPRFRTAGICPFLSNFMTSACPKSCNGCKNLTRKGDVVKPPLVPYKTKKPAPENPMMHLTFGDGDSSEVVKDHSGKNNNAKLLNGAKVSKRKLGTCGSAAEINGGDLSWQSRDFIGASLDAVTLAMWVKSKRMGSFTWFGTTGSSKTIFSSNTGTKIPAKVWTHIAGTYDSKTDRALVFINGELAEEKLLPPEVGLIQAWLRKGVGEAFADSNLRYVDEVYLYDRALKAKEIRQLSSECEFNRMVIHYGFQKENDTKIIDQSGLENNAVMFDGAKVKNNCERCGSCLTLNSNPKSVLRVQRVAVNSLPTRSVSLAVWVSLDSTKGEHVLFTTRNAKQPAGYYFAVKDGKVVWAAGSDKGGSIFNETTPEVVVPETLWTHVLVTYSSDDGITRIFVNGALKHNSTVSLITRTFPLSTDWDGGAQLGGDNFRGSIDEFLMYNWNLESSEATYVRDYCAEQPKLVRFTVRVPLTKRNFIQAAKGRPAIRIQHNGQNNSKIIASNNLKP